jgi:hypothetical protein
MDTQSDRKTAQLANVGCALGVLSLGFIAFAFVSPFIFDYNNYELAGPLVAGFRMVLSAIVSWLLGFFGSVISLIALRKIVKGSGENISKGIAITGLVLGGLGVVIVCILLAYVLIFFHPTPPPVMITPSQLIPLPTGG